MKKIVLIAILFCGMVGISNAQVMKQGDNALNLGIGLPNVGNIKLPAIVGAFDHGFSGKLGIGYISGGAQASIYRSGYTSFGSNYSRTYLVFGPRAAYHFDFKDIRGSSGFDNLDIYAGVLAGISVEPYKIKYADGTKYNKTYVNFAHDVFVGIRYNFAPAVGVYAEAGYGVAYISAGLTFKM